jgi:hypothetical protein
MIVILHKHNIMLVNPSNLASWKLIYLNLPLMHVKFVVLTKFTMAFVEFLVAEREKEHKIDSFLIVVTLDWIYEKVKHVLKQVFLWSDELIRAKIAFRVIPSNVTNT